MSDELKKLLDAAPPMSPSEREEQVRSFAYGNAAIENKYVTREMVDRAADEIAGEKASEGKTKPAG